MDRNNKPAKKYAKPSYKIEDVSFDENGHVHVDWQSLGLARELTDRELLCLEIYNDYRNEHGCLPKPEHKHALIRKESIKRGIEPPISRDEIEDKLLAYLFPLNDHLAFSSGVRRLLSEGRGQLTGEEYLFSLQYLSEYLTKSSPTGEVIYPTTGDMDRAAKSGLVVPKLATLIPNSTALLTCFKGESFQEISEKLFGVKREDLFGSHALRIEISDLENDYLRVHTILKQESGLDSDLLVEYSDLDRLSKLGSSRYKTVFGRESRANGVRINLNTLRRSLCLPIDPDLDGFNSRPRIASKLTRLSIYRSYMAAWDFEGRDKQAPSPERLDELVEIQNQLIIQGHIKELPEDEIIKNRNGQKVELEGDRTFTLDPQAATEAGVPVTILPSRTLICNHFDNMADFLGFCEVISGEDIEISSKMRNLKMAAEVINHLKRQNEGKINDRRARMYLDKIPNCVASSVRNQLALEGLNL